MQLTKIETDKAPAALGPYLQAIKAGDFLYCSGQVPLVAETGDCGADSAIFGKFKICP